MKRCGFGYPNGDDDAEVDRGERAHWSAVGAVARQVEERLAHALTRPALPVAVLGAPAERAHVFQTKKKLQLSCLNLARRNIN